MRGTTIIGEALLLQTTMVRLFGVLLLLVTIMFAVTPANLFAAPFAEFVEYTQPDNTKILLWGEGDEFHANFETSSGYSVVYDPNSRSYFFADVSSDGKHLKSTGVLAHHQVPPGLVKHLRADKKTVRDAALAKRKRWEADTELAERWSQLKQQSPNLQGAAADNGPEQSPPSSTTTGAKVGLTLLIDFSDDPATIPQASIESFLNGDNYTDYGNNGSVKKYFSDVSNGTLTYTNVVTLYVRMDQPKSYYNDTSKDNGTQGRLLIIDALTILKNRPDYSSTILPLFNSLTVDASNRVVAFNVFYAGGNGGVWSYGLWPHSWALASPVALNNGKSVYKYQITNVGTSLAIGTFSHENGHMLCGFPDLYDYGYDSIGGAGKFSLMGSGANLNSGRNPSQVDAYLKLAAGWASAIDIDNTSNLAGTLTAAPNNGFNSFYRFRRPGVSTEYFLLENRQMTGRDSYLPAAGIAVWHVDQLGNRDNQSMTPNATHQNYELTLVQADNLWHFESNTNSGDVKDLYYLGNSAAAYTNRFDNSSTPNGNWWDGTPSGINLNAFGASGMSMSFNVGNRGGCGTANIGAFSVAPAANLCSVGNPSEIFGIGPWFWSCNGLNGGTSTSCMAFTSSQTATGAAFPQSFDAAVTPPALPSGWSSTVSSGSGGSWQTKSGTAHPSGISAHSTSNLVYFNSYSTAAGGAAILASPAFSLVGKTSGKVSFWMYHDTGASTLPDRVDVYINTTSNLTGAVLIGYANRYAGTSGWSQHTLEIPASFAGAVNYLLLNGVSAYGNDIHLDDITVYAFTPLYPLGFTFSGNGYGSVNSAPSGISCVGTAGNNCAVVNFNAGDNVTLTALPDVSSEHYSIFSSWTTNTTPCPGTGTCGVTMNAPVKVTGLWVRDKLVKIPATGSTYDTILDSLASAGEDTVIRVRDNSGLTPFDDVLTIDKGITLIGGCDATFADGSGYSATIGRLTVKLQDDHPVKVQRLILRQ